MAKGILVAFGSPVSADAEPEFNRWYDEVHVPELLAVAGFSRARRYRISPAQMLFYAEAAARFTHSYLAIYDVESDDPQAALVELERAAAHFENSDAMNYQTLSAVYFEQIAENPGQDDSSAA